MATSLSIESSISIPGNCFAPKGYVKSNPATGLLSTRNGDRLIAVPELLLRSIPKTLRAEAGEASYLALYTFGDNWGKTFCNRIMQDIVKYYRQPILTTIASEFFVHTQEAWAVHGLGRPAIDFRLAERGLLVVTIANSGIGGDAPIESDATYRSFSLESGFLAGWFSALTDQKLKACAINWSNPTALEFLVGSGEHIESIERKHLDQGAITPDLLNSL
jgi:uncharacterized protein